jgi:formamidopyrimidine-DNA glycosylase
MPEILEIETYRALAERAALGRRIAAVVVDDRWYVKGGPPEELAAALLGCSVVRVRRRGKLLLLDLDADRVLGLRFGMTGTLQIDGTGPIDRLLYSPASVDPRYDRFAVEFDDGGDLRISDPRRLGGVELDPDEDRLGPDALTISEAELAAAMTGRAPLKARLLDQARVAGIGNLLADEMLWRAGLAPGRAAGSLDPGEVANLYFHLHQTLVELGARGGSHTGDLMAERHPGGHCPRDGTELRVATIGGRTSWWCPAHQR